MPIRRPNCSRSATYPTLSSSARAATPTASSASIVSDRARSAGGTSDEQSARPGSPPETTPRAGSRRAIGENLALGAFQLPDGVADDRDAGRGVEVEREAGRARASQLASCRHRGLIVGRQEREQAARRPERPVQQRAPRLLVQDCLLEEREACAATLLGHARARPAELGELRPGRLGCRLEQARACARSSS